MGCPNAVAQFDTSRQSSLFPGLLFHLCSSLHETRFPVTNRIVSSADSQYDRRTSTKTPSTSNIRIFGSAIDFAEVTQELEQKFPCSATWSLIPSASFAPSRFAVPTCARRTHPGADPAPVAGSVWSGNHPSRLRCISRGRLSSHAPSTPPRPAAVLFPFPSPEELPLLPAHPSPASARPSAQGQTFPFPTLSAPPAPSPPQPLGVLSFQASAPRAVDSPDCLPPAAPAGSRPVRARLARNTA